MYVWRQWAAAVERFCSLPSSSGTICSPCKTLCRTAECYRSSTAATRSLTPPKRSATCMRDTPAARLCSPSEACGPWRAALREQRMHDGESGQPLVATVLDGDWPGPTGGAERHARAAQWRQVIDAGQTELAQLSATRTGRPLYAHHGAVSRWRRQPQLAEQQLLRHGHQRLQDGAVHGDDDRVPVVDRNPLRDEGQNAPLRLGQALASWWADRGRRLVPRAHPLRVFELHLV